MHDRKLDQLSSKLEMTVWIKIKKKETWEIPLGAIRRVLIHYSMQQSLNKTCPCGSVTETNMLWSKNQLWTDLSLFLTSSWCDNKRFKSVLNIQTCQTVKTIQGPNSVAGKIMSRSGFRASTSYTHIDRGKLEDTQAQSLTFLTLSPTPYCIKLNDRDRKTNWVCLAYFSPSFIFIGHSQTARLGSWIWRHSHPHQAVKII